MTGIKGIGKRLSSVIIKKAGIDFEKRAGELTEQEIEKIVSIIQSPLEYNIPE